MKLSSALACLAGASLLIPSTVSAQVFSGTGTGAIPDGGMNGPADWGTPLNVTFNVAGLAAPIMDISLSITLYHPYVGDLEAVLIPPTGSGASSFVIFSGIGQQVNLGDPTLGSPGTFGAFPPLSSPEAYTYTFSDSASGNLWAAAGFDTTSGNSNFENIFDLPAGSYRTSVAGPWDEVGNPNGGNHNAGQLTSFALDTGFVGLTSSQANGTWTLRLRDGSQFDVGTVTAATMTLVPVPEPSKYAIAAGIGLLVFAGYRRYSAGKA